MIIDHSPSVHIQYDMRAYTTASEDPNLMRPHTADGTANHGANSLGVS